MSPELAHHIALDARLVEAVGAIRLLQAVSWPVAEQEVFLEGFRRGQARLPQPAYRSRDLSAARAELAAIRDAADAQHPLGQYLQRSAESWLHAAWLIEAAGSKAASWHSIQLFGRPGDALPGSTYTNIDAARHFIEIADEVSGTLPPEDGEAVYSAEAMAAELQAALDAFFVGHRVRVEVDPELIAKAAAGPTRIRLRARHGCGRRCVADRKPANKAHRGAGSALGGPGPTLWGAGSAGSPGWMRSARWARAHPTKRER
jgi:hypothetical protein